MLKEVCKDVKVEPELLPIGTTETASSNMADKARLDVSAVGLWSAMERTFLDVSGFPLVGFSMGGPGGPPLRPPLRPPFQGFCGGGAF